MAKKVGKIILKQLLNDHYAQLMSIFVLWPLTLIKAWLRGQLRERERESLRLAITEYYRERNSRAALCFSEWKRELNCGRAKEAIVDQGGTWWRIILFSFRVMNMVKLFKKAFWKFPLDIKIACYLDVNFSSSWKKEESWIQA